MGMSRRQVRENIFRLLFNYGFWEEEQWPPQAQMYFDKMPDEDLPGAKDSIGEEDRAFIEQKAALAAAAVPRIDERINRVARGWRTTRMPRADLTILRLAVYEMEYDDAIPVGVAINEAVELAKKYGDDESPAFINGILARLSAEKKAGESGPADRKPEAEKAEKKAEEVSPE